jgi:hypothetical protein
VGDQHDLAAADGDPVAPAGPGVGHNIAAYGSRPLGAAIGGFVGGLYGAETALVVAAAGFLVQAVVILVSPVRRLARQPRMAP